MTAPTLEFEAGLHRQGARFVIGMDEVGRGAIAGPVGVGVCVVQASMPGVPEGLRDSKLVSEKRRTALLPLVQDWGVGSAVGLASAEEIDRLGISACLGLAGKRALAMLHEAGIPAAESVIVVDGHHDWLTPALTSPLRVMTRVKADRDCASVSAASIVAKVHRDGLMADGDSLFPVYGWARNKGYGSAAHREAIARHGASEWHRHTWLKTPALLADPDVAGVPSPDRV